MMESNANKELTLSHSNYFAPGTYMAKFKQEFAYAGVANILTMTLLAPLERWRIIAQTQKAYPLRPKKFKHFFDYFTSKGMLKYRNTQIARIYVLLERKPCKRLDLYISNNIPNWYF